MLTITEYLNEIFENFKEHCDKGTESMWKLVSKGKTGKNAARLGSDGSSVYSEQRFQQLYLLKYAYEYFFEYLSMYNTFIEDFADREEISVVSLGCGTMLDYWALAYVLDKKNMSRPVVKYHGIDAIEWNPGLKIDARDKGNETFKFFPEPFEIFFKKTDNEFHTHDIYFLPKSISEFNTEDEKNEIEMMMDNLSETEKDTIYFCISLIKGKKSVNDVGKVQKIIESLENEKMGFRVQYVKCITDTKETVDKIEKELHVEKNVEPILLGKKKSGNAKKIWETDILKDIGGYPKIPEDDPISAYIKELNTKCKHRSPEKDTPCNGCAHFPCDIWKEKRMARTIYPCDLIIKFQRERG